MEIRAHAAPWNAAIEFLLRDGEALGVNVIMETPPTGMSVEPTFRLEYQHAQTLMDDLWNCGLRPTEGAGSAGAMAATQAHLQDMRKLVFEK